MKLTDMKVINSGIREIINGEYTLYLKMIAQSVDKGTSIEADGQPFRVSQINRHGVGSNIVEIYAEHVSYELNEPLPLTGNTYTLNGDYTAVQAFDIILSGTTFVKGLISVTGSATFELKEMTRKQALLKVAEAFNGELVYDERSVGLVEQRGSDNGVQFKYAKNLKGITQIETSKGIGYKIDIVELRDIIGVSEAFELGDTVEIDDETLGVSVKQRILSIEYDPLNRINTKVEVGQREQTVAEVIEEIAKTSPEIEYNKILDVVKEVVFAADTIHATTAWVEEMEVNYLRSNFHARLNDAGATWDYVYIHDMQIEFRTANLHATEKVQYETVSGRPLYWTAIGTHIDAYKYFTMTLPRIPAGAVATIDGVLRAVTEDDFKVMVPKITSEATKMKLSFETMPGGNTLYPVMQWGQGTGQGQYEGKAYIYKDVDNLMIKHYVTETTYNQLQFNNDGVQVFTNTEGSISSKQVRNFHVVDNINNLNMADVSEGDIVCVTG